jgi:hypothetical protein
MAEVTKPTQKFVQIREIRDGVAYLNGGGLRKLLIVSGINFELKSEAEQGMILAGFQKFLNSLDFPVQFFIHSRKVNIDKYLETMGEKKQAEKNELIKVQIDEYINFIRGFVEQNAIISKIFFVAIPYDPVNISAQASGLFGLFGKSKSKEAQQQAAVKIEENLEQLSHRSQQVMEGLGQIGLRAVPLEDEELVELFYNLYNPQLQDKKVAGISEETAKNKQ